MESIATSPAPSQSRAVRLLAALFICPAIVWMSFYIATRLLSTYPLDAFEEFELLKAVRWVEGVPIYQPPNQEVFPTAYPPLHYWILGLWTSWFGVSFLSARILSVVAFAATNVLIVQHLIRGRHPWISVLAFTACFLAMHPLTDKWFELCKSDSLLVLFLAIAFLTARGTSKTDFACCTAALVAASLTKQNGLLFVLPLSVGMLMERGPKVAAIWTAATVSAIALAYGLVWWSSAGWFGYWVFVWPLRHGVDWVGGADSVLSALSQMPWCGCVLAGSLIFHPRSRWTILLWFSLGVGWMGMSKHGGLQNHLYPMALVVALLTAHSVSFLRRRDLSGFIGGRLVRIRHIVLVVVVISSVLPGIPKRSELRWVNRRAEEIKDWQYSVRLLRRPYAVDHHFLLARSANAECFFSGLILRFPAVPLADSSRECLETGVYQSLVLADQPQEGSELQRCLARRYQYEGELKYTSVSGVLPRFVYTLRR